MPDELRWNWDDLEWDQEQRELAGLNAARGVLAGVVLGGMAWGLVLLLLVLSVGGCGFLEQANSQLADPCSTTQTLAQQANDFLRTVEPVTTVIGGTPWGLPVSVAVNVLLGITGAILKARQTKDKAALSEIVAAQQAVREIDPQVAAVLKAANDKIQSENTQKIVLEIKAASGTDTLVSVAKSALNNKPTSPTETP